MPDRETFHRPMKAAQSTWIPYSGMRRVSRLFATYCTDYQRLSPFFAGYWRESDSFARVASRLGTRPQGWKKLVDILKAQNEKWGDAPALEKLASPDALAVVTGQQVGIFGGPLYTLYKAITAVKLARHLEEELARPVVPIFWLEGGDHDFDEVSSIVVPSLSSVFRARYAGHTQPAKGNLGSVGALTFTSDISRVVGELREVLPNKSGLSDVFNTFYHAYVEDQSFSDAFARTLVRMLGQDLVLIDPEWPEVKQLAAPFLRRAIRSHDEIYKRLGESTAKVAQRFHAQVHPRPVNLFVLSDCGREAVNPDSNGFRLSVSGLRLSQAELLGLPPERLSPNVVLRPLTQDFLLPTVAYVAGPGEIAYFAQFKALYEWAKRPMPVIFPRASLTIVEPRADKTMARYQLGVEDLQADISQLMRRIVLRGSSLEAAFTGAADALAECAAALQLELECIELTLGRSVEATRAHWLKELQKLQRRAERAEKGRHEQVWLQLQRCRNMLFPDNTMQERIVPALYYLAKYGDAFLEVLRQHIRIDRTDSHQVLSITGC